VTCGWLERDLSAYVDGELDAAAAAAMRTHLAACARCRALVAEREALGRMIRAIPYSTAPDDLRARISARTSRSSGVSRLLTLAAAAALVLAAGAGFVLFRSRPARPDILAAAVVDAHVRSLMGDHLFDVESTDQHTVKPWFMGRLDFSPPVVDLAPSGFPLVGGRLEYLDGRPVAALVYRRRTHVINVFIAPARGGVDAAGETTTVRGFHVRHWGRDGMSFWAVSDVNDADLSAFAHALGFP
jgi:anti-sigma factor RsiW